MTKKKLWLVFIPLLAVIICSLGAVFAYLADRDTKTNTLNIGHGEETVSEIFSSPERQLLQNNVVQKEVYVHNDGETPCYVRVYVALSDSDLKSKVKIACEENGTYYTLEEFKTELAVDDQTVNTNWQYIPEDANHPNTGGYFYYKLPCEANTFTEPLFKYVKTDHSTGESYLSNNDEEDFISDFNFIVYSETVQTVDHSTGEVIDWFSAWRKFLRENETT